MESLLLVACAMQSVDATTKNMQITSRTCQAYGAKDIGSDDACRLAARDGGSKLQTTCWEATGFYCYKDRGICATFPTCDRAEPNTKCQCGAKNICDKSTGFYCDPVADLCSPTSFFTGYLQRSEGSCGDYLGMSEITNAEMCYEASRFITNRDLTCSGAQKCSFKEENFNRWTIRRDVIARVIGKSQAAIEAEKQRKAEADPQKEVPPMGCSVLVDSVSGVIQEPVFRLLPTSFDCPYWQQAPGRSQNGSCIEDLFAWKKNSEKDPCVDPRDIIGYGATRLSGKNSEGKAALEGQCYSQTSLMRWIDNGCPDKDILQDEVVEESRKDAFDRYMSIFKPNSASNLACFEREWWSDKNQDILDSARPDDNGPILCYCVLMF